jgi:glyoxylase-like metal-dependent hydrolase (beta-lactamase superfamily II)
MWPPTSSTLIFGERDAVLVDALITVPQATALGDWVAARGKNLTTIYATHGHGDHFLGASTILQRFPHARFVAWPGVVAAMRRQVSAQSLTTRWDAWFPGQISDHPVIAEPLSSNVIALEGTSLEVVPVGHTDTDDTTCLHVPSIGLIVAGDAVYNGVHLHLEESDQRGRRAWLAALAAIEALRPRVVIAGHKRPGSDDSPGTIEETRQYIRDFERANETTTTALELYENMMERHGSRENPGALWSSARAAKG